MSLIYKWLYNIGFSLFAMLYLPAFFLKGKAGQGVSARLGRPPAECLAKLAGGKVVWLHAVSVGEIGLAVRWAGQLKARMPEARILFTTTTVTAFEVANKIKSDEDAICYFPADWGWAVSAFIGSTSPSLVVLFETEIWPNLIGCLHKRRIPVFIVNGRISDRAFNSYLKAKPYLRTVLNQLSGIGVQDGAMKERFILLGAEASRVQVTGNLKFEWSPGAKIATSSLPDDPSVFTWLCASTHEGEEEKLMAIFLRLRERYAIRLVMAPRHVTRVAQVEKVAQKNKLAVRKYTDQFALSDANSKADLYLVDSMGVLSAFYPAADAVFMGGSLVPVGGHNLVEPAYFGKPILVGPYMNNFKSMVEEFKKEQASFCAANEAELEEKLVEWICDRHKRVAVGEAAKQLVGRHRGATQKNLDYVLPVLEQSFGRRLISV